MIYRCHVAQTANTEADGIWNQIEFGRFWLDVMERWFGVAVPHRIRLVYKGPCCLVALTTLMVVCAALLPPGPHLMERNLLIITWLPRPV